MQKPTLTHAMAEPTRTSVRPETQTEIDLRRSLIVEDIAHKLLEGDELRIGYLPQTWENLSADTKSWFRERAVMALRLCDLAICRTAHFRLACAIAERLSGADADAVESLRSDEQITQSADDLLEELAALGLTAMFTELKNRTLEERKPEWPANVLTMRKA